MPAQDRQTAPYGVFSKAREERNEDGLRLRHKEKAADALHTQAGTTAACRRQSSRPPGGTLVIRLKDRQVEDSVLQPLALKIDPGSQTTGMTLARVEDRSEGAIHHAVLLAEVQHRGHEVRARKVTQRHARRRRRSANLRHRAARAANRRIARGWLPPSLLSRIGNVVSWTKRLRRFAPVTRVDVECVRFDTQLLQNPEITGVQYQHAELLGGKYEPISCSNMRTSASTAENATH